MNYFKPRKAWPGKYGAQRVSHAGFSFASKLEAALYDLLHMEKLAGVWTEIQCQASVRLSKAEILYKPDFATTTAGGVTIYHEAKGYETDVWRIKRRLWIAYGPGVLRIYKGSAARIYLAEELNGGGE